MAACGSRSRMRIIFLPFPLFLQDKKLYGVRKAMNKTPELLYSLDNRKKKQMDLFCSSLDFVTLASS
jgi:hypothetical protein